MTAAKAMKFFMAYTRSCASNLPPTPRRTKAVKGELCIGRPVRFMLRTMGRRMSLQYFVVLAVPKE